MTFHSSQAMRNLQQMKYSTLKFIQL